MFVLTFIFINSSVTNRVGFLKFVYRPTYYIVRYTVFYRTHAPPQIDAPPKKKFLDHVPEVSGPMIYMTTLFNDRFNAVLSNDLFVASHEIIQMYTKKQRSFTAYYSYRSNITSSHFISVECA